MTLENEILEEIRDGLMRGENEIDLSGLRDISEKTRDLDIYVEVITLQAHASKEGFGGDQFDYLSHIENLPVDHKILSRVAGRIAPVSKVMGAELYSLAARMAETADTILAARYYENSASLLQHGSYWQSRIDMLREASRMYASVGSGRLFSERVRDIWGIQKKHKVKRSLRSILFEILEPFSHTLILHLAKQFSSGDYVAKCLRALAEEKEGALRRHRSDAESILELSNFQLFQ